ncbi:MAG: hypothetical protein ACI8Y7_000999, partial [Candidatus Woesearchaeota archaeon]
MKINPKYTKAVDQAKEAMLQNDYLPNVHLGQFFSDFDAFSKSVWTVSLQESKELMKENYFSAKLSSSLLDTLWTSEFQTFIKTLTGVSRVKEAQIVELSHRSFSMLHDNMKKPTGWHVLIDVTSDWEESWGGVPTYIDNDKEPVEVLLSYNSVFVVKNAHMFFKYANHYAKKHRFILI